MLIQCKSIFLSVGSAFCDSCQISTSHGIRVFPSQVESEKTADRKPQRGWMEKKSLVRAINKGS